MRKKTYRVLVVDDCSTIRQTIILMLETGFDCTLVFVEAEDGEEALAKFQAAGFDLVISDLNMPKMNGLELVKKIRSMDFAVPILMVTVNDDKLSASEAIRAGVTDYMVKPFHQRMLVDTCARCLTDRPNNVNRPYRLAQPDCREPQCAKDSDAIQV